MSDDDFIGKILRDASVACLVLDVSDDGGAGSGLTHDGYVEEGNNATIITCSSKGPVWSASEVRQAVSASMSRELAIVCRAKAAASNGGGWL